MDDAHLVDEVLAERADLEAAGESPRPRLWPDRNVSRAYRFHVLLLPGQEQPTFHRDFHTALRVVLDAGYNYLTIVSQEAYLDIAIHYER